MRTCGICTSPSHLIDVCPTLQQDDGPTFTKQIAIAANVFFNKPQYYHLLQQNRYIYFPILVVLVGEIIQISDIGTCNNRSLRLFQYQRPPRFQNNTIPNRSQSFQQAKQLPAPNQIEISMYKLEDLMQQLMTNILQFQQRDEALIQKLEMQVNQLASSISQLQATSSSQLPSQAISNPKGNVNAITLRSGKSITNRILIVSILNSSCSDKNSNMEMQPQPKSDRPMPLPFLQRLVQSRGKTDI